MVGFTQSGHWNTPFPLNLLTSAPWLEIRPKIAFDLVNDLFKAEMALLGDHATLAAIVIPGFQTLDREALTIHWWETFNVPIEIRAIKHEKTRDKKGRDLGLGTFSQAEKKKDSGALGYGAYVLNKDYEQANRFFRSIYPMTVRPDM